MEPLVPLGVIWLAWTFAVGAMVGSFVNLCADRLPLEKGVLWPPSRCDRCLSALRWYDNIPGLSFFLLRGKCRVCGTAIGARTPVLEIGTGLLFSGLFALVTYVNVYDIPQLRDPANLHWHYGVIPLAAWGVWLHHAVLAGFLLTASLCDLARREIPLSVTITGTIVGLALATLLPWPWPAGGAGTLVREPNWYAQRLLGMIPVGATPWPVWGPPPEWAPAGSWRLGLLTGLAGAAFGMLMLRVVRFVFTRGFGREAMGLGDADLMMMAGAFVGWQIVLVSFFLGAFLGLILAIPTYLIRRENVLPFGPGLSLGVMVALLCWHRMGEALQQVLFDPLSMGLFGFIGAVGMFVAALALRLLRGGGGEVSA